MIKYIHVSTDVRIKLIEEYGITDQGLRKMLHFNSNSEQAIAVRARALELGGEERCDAELFKTFWDSDGYVRQFFPNGVVLEMNKTTGVVELVRDDSVLVVYPSLTISQLGAVQTHAMTL